MLGEHEIRVGLGVGIFRVVEIEHRDTLIDATGNCRDQFGDGVGGNRAGFHKPLTGQMKGNTGTRNRGRPGATIGLQHVTVEANLALAKRFHIGDSAQGTANQALDFLGPARLFSARGFAIRALMGGAGQHAVFGCDPARARPAHPLWNTLFNTGGAQHMGIAEDRQTGALGVFGRPGLELDLAHLVCRAA